MTTTPPFLSNPVDFLFYHATQFSRHVIKTGEALYEVWEDSQISLADPDTSPVNGEMGGGGGAEAAESASGGLPEQAAQFHEAVSGTLDSILKGSIKPPGGSKLQSKESFFDDVSAFFAAIDFEADRWIFALLAFHVATFLCILKIRGKTELQAGLFVFLAVVIRACEPLNDYLGSVYVSPSLRPTISGGAPLLGSFSSQNYFTKDGSFAVVFVAFPALINCLLLVALVVREAGKLVVKVKTAELKDKKRREGQKKKNM
mmetsp:Transcript_20181/g.40401  ORF Transcript_20181/g.40401 Transcript_20181/m.40401 type:complete len:259 (-) Transcript_20181:28-804(-)